MDRGQDFLKSQVNNAVMQHQTLLEAIEDHATNGDDARYRDLCARHAAPMREHQRMLEDYQRELGAESGTGKKLLGKALGVARDLADQARESDFLRVVATIVMARQAEDTFKTFREAGRTLGIARLAEIGEVAERHHDVFNKEASRLVQQLFVEHYRGSEAGDTASVGASAGATP